MERVHLRRTAQRRLHLPDSRPSRSVSLRRGRRLSLGDDPRASHCSAHEPLALRTGVQTITKSARVGERRGQYRPHHRLHQPHREAIRGHDRHSRDADPAARARHHHRRPDDSARRSVVGFHRRHPHGGPLGGREVLAGGPGHQGGRREREGRGAPRVFARFPRRPGRCGGLRGRCSRGDSGVTDDSAEPQHLHVRLPHSGSRCRSHRTLPFVLAHAHHRSAHRHGAVDVHQTPERRELVARIRRS